jgi:hypothetical protein
MIESGFIGLVLSLGAWSLHSFLRSLQPASLLERITVSDLNNQNSKKIHLDSQIF